MCPRTAMWLLACLLLGIADGADAEARFRAIALTGQQAPGTESSFARFGLVTINESGEVAFDAAVGLDPSGLRFDTGIWGRLPAAPSVSSPARERQHPERRASSSRRSAFHAQQRERIEAKLAKPSTTRRDARLLRAGTSRRPEARTLVEAQP